MFHRIDGMKIREKLKYGYTLVIVLMVGIAVFAALGLFFVQGKMNSYIKGAQAADTAVKECRINANIAARNIREMTLDANQNNYPGYKENISKSTDGIGQALEDLKSAGVISEDLSQRYEESIRSWLEVGYSIIDTLDQGDRAGAGRQIINECAPALQESVKIAEEIDAQTEKLKKSSLKISQRTVLFVVVTMAVVLGIAIFLAVKVGTRIVRSIVKPLKEIEDAAIQLSDGNLHTEILYSGEDEIGMVAQALRSSVERLWSYVEDIDFAMKEFSQGNFDVQTDVEYKGDFTGIKDSFAGFEKNMSEMVKNVQSVADQVSRASEQISASSMNLAEGASDQAGATQELSATIENVSEQIARNAKEAIDISEEVQQVGVEIDHGNKKMQEMVESMEHISKSSNEISKIIAAINEIAEQTNLLALNASIEAARAGEAGKGFAVVADQVSVLAAQSAAAATESTSLIEESVRAVEGGMKIANETAGQLENVVKGSKSITEKVNLIAEASKEQAEAVVQINSGVDQINVVVQNNSSTSEECAAASEEMTAQAETLNGLIRQFKVAKF